MKLWFWVISGALLRQLWQKPPSGGGLIHLSRTVYTYYCYCCCYYGLSPGLTEFFGSHVLESEAK